MVRINNRYHIILRSIGNGFCFVFNDINKRLTIEFAEIANKLEEYDDDNEE
jgi:hypothetical protein